MKRHIVLLIILLAAMLPLISEEYEKKLESLLSERQYLTAMNFLNEIDPENKDIGIVSGKVDIFLDFFGQSINHEMFGLKDLTADETIESLRENGGNFNVFHFDIPEVLSFFDRNDDQVKKLLIRFYISLNNCYGHTEKYREPMKAAIEIAEEMKNRTIINESDAAALALYFLKNNDPGRCIGYYQTALVLNPDNPFYNYNTAYAYILLEKYNDAAAYAKTAFTNYQEAALKKDAYLMLGDIYLHTGSLTEALNIFQELNNEQPNLFIERKIIQVYELLHNDSKASELAVDYLLKIQAQESPVYRLANAFIEIEAPDKFVEYSNLSISKYDKNHERNAMIYYYQSYIYYQLGDSQKSQLLLTKAKEELSLHTEKNADLMGRIDNLLD